MDFRYSAIDTERSSVSRLDGASLDSGCHIFTAFTPGYRGPTLRT